MRNEQVLRFRWVASHGAALLRKPLMSPATWPPRPSTLAPPTCRSTAPPLFESLRPRHYHKHKLPACQRVSLARWLMRAQRRAASAPTACVVRSSSPPSCLPAGLPLTVSALALLSVPWRAAIQQKARSFSNRFHIDDVLVWWIGGGVL